MSWQPTTPIEHIRARARLNQIIRDFFAEREVLEVETPLLCSATATDPYLASWQSQYAGQDYFLQTSPEFCMKRLLAAGSGPIYQLGKAFRLGESSRRHNPEFTLLEWYRPGWTLPQLMQEVEQLVACAAAAFGRELGGFPTLSFADAFAATVGLDPHHCSDAALLQVANQHLNGDFASLDRDGLLDLLASHLMEAGLPASGAFVTAFPASKASLAQTTLAADGAAVALRTELYIGGLEIANGYQELTQAREQAARFRQDQRIRQQQGLPAVPMPEQLVAALQAGLPDCAGVALGVDRLLMVLLQCASVDDVISFPLQRA